MMMNCMGMGTGSTVVAGIRLADWAIALTYMLAALLLIVAVVAIARVLFFALPARFRASSHLATTSPPRASEP